MTTKPESRAPFCALLVVSALCLACEDISPVDTVLVCEADDAPPDCTCADPEDPDRAIGTRSAICPECQAEPPHPDCENADAGLDASAGLDGSGRADASPGPDAAAALAPDASFDATNDTPVETEAGPPDAGRDAAAVECERSQQCPNERPVCLLAQNACVECVTSDDCQNRPGKACDTDENRCQECVAAADCLDPAAPVCDLEGPRCVQCLDDDDCEGAEGLCDDATQECVECLEHADCTDPDAARCSGGSCAPCEADEHCDGVADKGVCGAGGSCVECTGANYSACGDDGVGNDYVCDSLAEACTALRVGSSGLCQPCVSDAQCDPGQLCVQQEFDAAVIGYFCHWNKGSGEGGAPSACSMARPFVATSVATSIDGMVAEVCGLAVTTCVAHNEFRSASVDCEPSPDSPDDSLCGADGVDDAYCRPFDDDGMGDTFYRCTMPCVTDDDCRSSSSCDLGQFPNVCTFP